MMILHVIFNRLLPPRGGIRKFGLVKSDEKWEESFTYFHASLLQPWSLGYFGKELI